MNSIESDYYFEQNNQVEGVLDLLLFTNMRLQSSIAEMNNDSGSNLESEGLVQFNDEEKGDSVRAGITSTTEKVDYSINSDLSAFLKRPVNINTYTWELAGEPGYFIEPWYLFLNHPSIKKKIDNYYLIRGNLKLKFVLNASPFYYGAMLISYNPLEQYHKNNSTEGYIPNIKCSQMPHVYLYPQNSQGGEMDLPFFFHREWLELTSESMVRAMGSLHIRSMAPLANANGASAPITIQIYAWMEDVQLFGPTSTLSLQSSKDEYGSTIISDTASAVARAAGMLSDVPIIGPFATSTSIISGAIGTVAKLFGYTNVPIIAPPQPMMPKALPNMASTDIGTPIETLALDSKNGLTIDSSSVGIPNQDELMISHLVMKESYIGTLIPWETSDPADALLWNFRVNPSVCAFSAGPPVIVDTTPLFMVSKLFAKWRGDIQFRFKVISSQYHRGRLRFTWDPKGNSSTVDTTTEAYNRIVDIAEENDITIRIPYIQSTAYLETYEAPTQLNSSSAIDPLENFDNGVLSVRVLTELTAPIDTASILIIVYVSGCENLEFMQPVNPNESGRFSRFTLQSSMVPFNSSGSDSISMKNTITPQNINLLYGGESVKSLRTLLRRPCFSRSVTLNGSTGSTLVSQIHRSIFSRYPLEPGYDPNGIHTATGIISGTSKPYNWTGYTYINWIGSCFVGTRGSIMWYVNISNPALVSQVNLTRNPSKAALSKANYNSAIASASTNNIALSNFARFTGSGHAGSAITNQRNLSAISAVVPYYSKYKFRFMPPSTCVEGTTTDDSNVDLAILDSITAPANLLTVNAAAMGSNMFNFYCAIGPDFSFLYYLATPTLYYYPSVPVAN